MGILHWKAMPAFLQLLSNRSFLSELGLSQKVFTPGPGLLRSGPLLVRSLFLEVMLELEWSVCGRHPSLSILSVRRSLRSSFRLVEPSG